MTVLSLLVAAGGVTSPVDQLGVQVISSPEPGAGGQAVAREVNLAEVRKGINLDKNVFALKPGDQLIVRPRK